MGADRGGTCRAVPVTWPPKGRRLASNCRQRDVGPDCFGWSHGRICGRYRRRYPLLHRSQRPPPTPLRDDGFVLHRLDLDPAERSIVDSNLQSSALPAASTLPAVAGLWRPLNGGARQHSSQRLLSPQQTPWQSPPHCAVVDVLFFLQPTRLCPIWESPRAPRRSVAPQRCRMVPQGALYLGRSGALAGDAEAGQLRQEGQEVEGPRVVPSLEEQRATRWEFSTMEAREGSRSSEGGRGSTVFVITNRLHTCNAADSPGWRPLPRLPPHVAQMLRDSWGESMELVRRHASRAFAG